MTIELGWWLIPLAITLISFATAKSKTPPTQPSGYIPDVVSPMIGVGATLIAAVVSLLAWLIWALAT